MFILAARQRRWMAAGLVALLVAAAGAQAQPGTGPGRARATAGSEWVAVGGTERADIYMDPSTIERRARIRSLWLLHNLRQTDADGDRSWRVQVEYDCEHTIYRTVQVLFFAEGMGNGRPRARSGAPTNWRAAEPDSINAKLMQALCAPPRR